MATVTADKRTAENEKLQVVDPGDIVDNPYQPRESIDPDRLEELKISIDVHGLLEPPVGRWKPGEADTLELAFGHRRVAAVRQLVEAGEWEGGVAVLIRDLTDAQMALTALTENSEREDLTPIETIRAYRRTLDAIPELSKTELAESLGVGRSTLVNNLRILKLPAVVLDRVQSGEMTPRAARVFLCLMNDDHAHVDDMEWVVRNVGDTRLGEAPDWRVDHVRQMIRQRVVSNDREWRPLEARPQADKRAYEYGASNAGQETTFDTEAFGAELPAKCHTVPNYEGTSGRLWTCDAREWRKRQSAATRAANKDAEAKGQPRPSDQPRGANAAELRKKFGNKLARDPMLKAVRAFNRTVSGETGGKGADLTSAEREALGVRADMGGEAGYGLVVVDEHPGDNRTPPVYFPDIEFCRTKCAIGARYMRPYGSWGETSFKLSCTNLQHYKEKLAEGRRAFKHAYRPVREAANERERIVTAALAARLVNEPELARLTAVAVLVSVGRFPTFNPIKSKDHRDTEGFDYFSGSASRIGKALDITPTDSRWGEFDLGHALEKLDTLDTAVAAEVAGDLVGMMLRAKVEEGVELAANLLDLELPDMPDLELPAPDKETAGVV